MSSPDLESFLSGRVLVVIGDITRQDVDAIVGVGGDAGNGAELDVVGDLGPPGDGAIIGDGVGIQDGLQSKQ